MPVAIEAIAIVVALSALGGWLFTAGKPLEKPVRVMMFVGYFWLLAFVQLSLIAMVYYIWRHSN